MSLPIGRSPKLPTLKSFEKKRKKQTTTSTITHLASGVSLPLRLSDSLGEGLISRDLLTLN